MIAALASYQDTLIMTAGNNTGQTAMNATKAASGAGTAEDPAGEVATDAVSVDLSSPQNVFTAVDSFFNLGKSNRFDDFNKLSPQDKEQFVSIVAELAKSGHVGYEELIVNNKVERHDMETRIGDRRLYNAGVYDSSYEEAF
jgi:hypothetical protein